MSALRVLFVAILIGSVYIWFSGQGLPVTMASHFDAGGQANGSMSRATYLGLMIGILVLVPLLTVGSVQLIRLAPMSLVRMPNKQHWLGPERRKATLAFIARQTAVFGCGLVLFLCWVHHLVVQANHVQPPRLAAGALVLGLLAFMALSFGWAGFFIARFARSPR